MNETPCPNAERCGRSSPKLGQTDQPAAALPHKLPLDRVDYFDAAGVGSPATIMSWVVGRMKGTHSTVEPSFMVAMTL